MMRVLVVEDDNIARNRLCAMVEWEALGCSVVGEASNGAEALGLIRALQPDLVLADVSMPVMDGMQMSRELAAMQRKPQLVMISSYSHYDYIRETFRNGARDYILKEDLTAERLEAVLKEAIRHKTQDAAVSLSDGRDERADAISTSDGKDGFPAAISASDKGGEIPAALSGVYPSLHTPLFVEVLMGLADPVKLQEHAGALIGLCRIGYYAHVTRRMDRVELHAHVRSVMGFVQEALEGMPVHLHWTGLGEFLVMLPKKGCSAAEAHACTAEVESRVTRCLSRYLELQVRFSWMTAERRQLHGAYQKLSSAFQKGGDDGRGLSMPWLVRMMDALQHEGADACGALLDGLFEQLEVQAHDTWTVQPTVLAVLNLLERQMDWLQLQPDRIGYSPEALYVCQTLTEVRDALKACCRSIVEGMSGLQGHRKSQHVEMALRYLHTHYQERVTLTGVAEYVGIAPNYLSGRFSAELGKTFVEYLNGIRVDKADELLQSQASSVKEVYHRVGFQSYNHFFKVYKSIRGSSPLQHIRAPLSSRATIGKSGRQ